MTEAKMRGGILARAKVRYAELGIAFTRARLVCHAELDSASIHARSNG